METLINFHNLLHIWVAKACFDISRPRFIDFYTHAIRSAEVILGHNFVNRTLRHYAASAKHRHIVADFPDMVWKMAGHDDCHTFL